MSTWPPNSPKERARLRAARRAHSCDVKETRSGDQGITLNGQLIAVDSIAKASAHPEQMFLPFEEQEIVLVAFWLWLHFGP